jgi:phytoene dehydrogenase-like protein
MNSQKHVDAIVIGAGLGGLLSAAQLLQLGKQVVVLERLPHSGGRFTAKSFHGVQVSTGAVHMVPFGSSGVLASTLSRLHVPYRFFDADVFGSFHVHGKQHRSRGVLGVYKFLGPRQFFWFTRLGYLMFFRPLPLAERHLPFINWLRRHIDVERNPQLVAFFERISRFALSLELDQVSAAEVIRTTKNMLCFGAPAIVEGGCSSVTNALEQHIRAQGGDVRLSCEVLQILHEDNAATGVRVRDKASGEDSIIHAPLLVSDIGPRATDGLLRNHTVTQSEVLQRRRTENTDGPMIGTAVVTSQVLDEAETDVEPREAVGLKVHVLSDVSLIPHKGIMYCLDTQRIAGMVQPTNSDPSLAPAGKHLLISHQVIQSDNIAEERALALADLRFLFGEAFDTHCHVLTMGTYRGEWPVNRMVQGEDVSAETALPGLYLVGDAVKPSGYLMVEGVAQSVNTVFDLLHKKEHASDLTDSQTGNTINTTARGSKYVVGLPSPLNALRWLWKAPGNAGKL